MSRPARHRSSAWSPCGRQPHSAHAGSGASDGPAPRHAARSRRHLEGVLKKYTNLLQGWQSRYFVLDPEVGQLQYYLNEVAKGQRPPRGSLPLLGAKVVSGSDFPFMFTVQSARGDFYKLRALDAQEQELWMTQLQLCSRRHSDSSAKVVSAAEGQQRNLLNSTESPSHQEAPLVAQDDERLILKSAPSATLSCLGECLTMFQHNVVQALNQNQNQNHLPGPLLVNSAGALSQAALAGRVKLWTQRCSGSVTRTEPGALRSDSRSPTHGSSESPSPSPSPRHSSYGGRQGSVQNHVQGHGPRQDGAHADGSTGWSRCPSENLQRQDAHMAPPPAACPSSTQPPKDPDLLPEQGQRGQASSSNTLDPDEETTDTEDNEEEDLGVLDDQRNIILHLLSQLKLGMDLTRVVLPTFILEKRSLLEMYANFMAHPDMFLSITSGCTPEERIIRFVEYYLTAFHEGRKGAVAKKPYNPVLGESFHCSWYVPRDGVRTLRTTTCAGPNSAPAGAPTVPGSSQKGTGGPCNRNSDCYRVRFVAEQVSHHPPVSGFYCECKEKRMCVNTHIWTKSKFMGMSVGVSMVGEGVLYLLEHDEEYVFTLPCAYARSILTVPWVELGGKVTISCAKSGYSATVTFHTKPFYGGKVHRVTAEVKHNQTGNTVCKAQGEWNGMLEFSYNNGENKVIDTSKLPITRKRIRPLEKQSQYESRRLWQHVTASLKAGNMDAATEHKRCLEERQRSESKQRAATKTAWSPKFFIKEGEGWVYHNPLWKAH